MLPVSPGLDPEFLGYVERNRVFCTMDAVELKLDLHFPEEAKNAWPVVIWVHGGGWRDGNKAGGPGIADIPALNEAGFLVVAVNYRLAPTHQFPAMIEDVRCAVRYLRAHTDIYNIDPNRIGVYGSSAGGHLAALLGTSGPETGWDVGEYLSQPSRVQAVVDYFGPTDLADAEFTSNKDSLWFYPFGAKDMFDPILAVYSPVSYVTSDDPPFLILHGEEDNDVPLSQSEILYEKLQEIGVPSQFVIVYNAGHGFAPSSEGAMSPSREEITVMVVNFFLEQLMP